MRQSEGQVQKQQEMFYEIEALMILLVQNDPDQALQFSKQQMKQILPGLLADRIKNYTGLAELLNDDILESKDFLVSSIQTDREVYLRQIAMNQNNLGVACWWDLYPTYSDNQYESSEDDSEEDFSEKAYKTKQSDYLYVERLFLRSIKNFEKDFSYQFTKDESYLHINKSYENLDKLMKQQSTSKNPNQQNLIEFQNPLSLIPAFNLTEFMLSNYKDTNQRDKALELLFYVVDNLRSVLQGFKEQDYQIGSKLYKNQLLSLYIRAVTFQLSLLKQDKNLFQKFFSWVSQVSQQEN